MSPRPLATDLRSADDRDLPSRTDAIAGALSQVIGGPVGRHALVGRARFFTTTVKSFFANEPLIPSSIERRPSKVDIQPALAVRRSGNAACS